ncbi:uncharacterized protein [Mycetomoellerius zeteki]|uniref:uncharacterized protein n=1 Tax=Mycetomoellerius zeteki TaxID=64791 RepID=UPI00084E7D60|nr:PREDICTED: uncharacterized protein LOC108731748 [Trachymyrmex zeteki]
MKVYSTSTVKILENTDIAKNSDDWNTIACGPEPNQGIIIPIPQDHIQDIPLPLTGKSLLIGPEELLKLKERSFRRKRALIEARASKINGNKLKPHLNLMETNSKKSRSLKKTGIKMTLASQENRSLKKIEKLIAENQALKAEISNLQAKISNTITLRQIGNIATQNRFDLLDNDISPQTDSSLTMDCQPLEDIASYLTKKNSQRTSISSEVKRNEKKHNSNVAVKHNDFSNKNVRDNEPNNNSGKKIRTEKPPPINILDQDVKDTTKLLKTKLTDKNSKSHKPLNLLLKGLDHNYSEQEVLEELKSQNIHNVKLIKVVRFSTNQNGKIAIDDIQDKLDVLGAHFASVNNRIMENDRPQLNEIIDKQVSSFKNKMHADFKNNVTIYRWKTAKVVALLKKNKDKEAPASYRPISLLPNNSKVFEIIINNRINDFCQKEHIIPDCQFGFRKQFSTIHAINRLTSDINWAFNDNKCVGAVLIDLEKAFDTV